MVEVSESGSSSSSSSSSSRMEEDEGWDEGMAAQITRFQTKKSSLLTPERSHSLTQYNPFSLCAREELLAVSKIFCHVRTPRLQTIQK